MARQLSGLLDQARRDAGLSNGEPWWRFVELGGNHPVAYADDDAPAEDPMR